MDGDRAAARGGRRLLFHRAERDRPRAGALRARRARAGNDRRRARLRPRARRVPLLPARGDEVVTAEQVWAALAEIPDPEIPVISVVDLGVIRDVGVENGTVRVDFTPTFLGCPALEVMRDTMAERIRALGAEPVINVRTDDSWSTDRITPAGREKLRVSGFAPPAPREATAPKAASLAGEAGDARPKTGSPSARLGLVQLQANVFRCPYCGSTETRLENIF